MSRAAAVIHIGATKSHVDNTDVSFSRTRHAGREGKANFKSVQESDIDRLRDQTLRIFQKSRNSRVGLFGGSFVSRKT